MSKASVLRLIKSSTDILLHIILLSAIETFAKSVPNFITSFSTATTGLAPLDAASKAQMPDPLKRSKNAIPFISHSIEKMERRILSIAGRITPLGHCTILFFNVPPVIRINS